MSAQGRRWPEFWVLASWGLAGLGVLAALVLGSRPGGELPVWIYRTGTLALGFAAALIAIVGLAVSVLRKPALQRGRLAGLLCALATLWGASFPLAYPSSHAGHPSRIELDLPFEGTRVVRFGGSERARNLLVLDPARCFGIAFESGKPSEEEAAGRAVLAPAPGRLRPSPDGTVVIEVAPEQFLFVEGIEPNGSARTADRPVRRGERIGTEGARGLTLYLADRPRVGSGEGIPMRLHALDDSGRRIEVTDRTPGISLRSALLGAGRGREDPRESPDSER